MSVHESPLLRALPPFHAGQSLFYQIFYSLVRTINFKTEQFVIPNVRRGSCRLLIKKQQKEYYMNDGLTIGIWEQE